MVGRGRGLVGVGVGSVPLLVLWLLLCRLLDLLGAGLDRIDVLLQSVFLYESF